MLWGKKGRGWRGGLQHLAQDLQQRLMGVRFLSCLGTEGSGHHALTPIIMKLFCIGSNISMSRCNSCHVAGPAFSLAGQTLPELTPMVNDLFEAFTGLGIKLFSRTASVHKMVLLSRLHCRVVAGCACNNSRIADAAQREFQKGTPRQPQTIATVLPKTLRVRP